MIEDRIVKAVKDFLDKKEDACLIIETIRDHLMGMGMQIKIGGMDGHTLPHIYIKDYGNVRWYEELTTVPRQFHISLSLTKNRWVANVSGANFLRSIQMGDPDSMHQIWSLIKR